ncbi:metallophosphoesterase [Bacteriovorax sp. Seq25_V]|uniref:metallophosphoesterase n=1 Tax=Bacteriovorax sp. Seq25_V TaxID=1201288 RepID=UPI000389E557|nr:metallophosphoesterase [Bacteriovorax sp. Seq25_V]EQC45994.1 Ser/Thr phosphatase domain protein [Bacteriovorax sp. Seq25_V]
MRIKSLASLLLFNICIFAGSLPFEIPKQKRLIAIGDIHGDFSVVKALLQKGGIVDHKMNWIAGDTTVVQVGDLLDRGPDEMKIINFLKKLEKQAIRAGGMLYVLQGNHELKNVDLRFSDVTEEGFAQFEKYTINAPVNELTKDVKKALEDLPYYQHGRVMAFRPGGEIAKYLSTHHTILKVGETIFVHGGVEAKYAEKGLNKINSDISGWMNGTDRRRKYFFEEDSPLYSRLFAKTENKSCKQLDKALKILGAKRMVIAHTVQKTINSDCDGKVWRIDTGMSSFYDGGGELGFIEIIYDEKVKIHRFL